jgi:glutaminyl-tRNA synthetase
LSSLNDAARVLEPQSGKMEPMNDTKTPPEGAHLTNFIRQHIERDLEAGKYAERRWGGEPGRRRRTPRRPSIRRRSARAFRPSPTGICTSGTRSRSA